MTDYGGAFDLIIAVKRNININMKYSPLQPINSSKHNPPESRLAAEWLAPSLSNRMELKKVVGERGVSFPSGLDGSSLTRMTGLSLR